MLIVDKIDSYFKLIISSRPPTKLSGAHQALTNLDQRSNQNPFCKSSAGEDFYLCPKKQTNQHKEQTKPEIYYHTD